jgi:hypothetical protein
MCPPENLFALVCPIIFTPVNEGDLTGSVQVNMILIRLSPRFAILRANYCSSNWQSLPAKPVQRADRNKAGRPLSGDQDRHSPANT